MAHLLFISSLLLLFSCWSQVAQGQQINLYAVNATIIVKDSPPSIELNWAGEECKPTRTCDKFYISKVKYNSTSLSYSNPVPLVTLEGTVKKYVDTAVSVGVTYEYKIERRSLGSSATPAVSFTTFTAAIKAPVVDYCGRVILLVESSLNTSLPDELYNLEKDLIGDGWSVTRVVVTKENTVPQVKNKIVQAYQKDPTNTKALYILGDVAVPYSGYTAPDAHYNNHKGAWPTDGYYADVVNYNSFWTDTQTFAVSSSERNINRAGDGKFDANSYGSATFELQVGRVDLANMGHADNYTALHKNYLLKTHNFRHGKKKFARRALVRDSLKSLQGEAPAKIGYRAFNTMFARENINTFTSGTGVLEHAASTDYLFFYAAGPGSFVKADGTGTTSDYAKFKPQFGFTMHFGSYFGDWDVSNSFLKAPLAYGSGMTCVWGGRPDWYFHHMGLGANVGRSAMVSMIRGSKPVQMNLMGDPTLRLYAVSPASNFRASKSGSQVRLTWTRSSDSNIVGYNVYRSNSVYGTFTKRNSAFIAGTSFTDTTPLSGTNIYIVRPIKLETTPSGSFYNAGVGVFARLER